ncbi:hypothetical protein FJU30_07510 [Affinibrenneria salicis]|uniref:Uncharacterized protein n=1 Tax=Affinibrenneria salicis TaxID=2590031 RepID=A0A5J5G2G9_9GAMM|nr:hypothetical protein [Affinibrenneria salicis]KAA9001095.1 hypothetical protein FJU30_07510 [Affinibrenneria salicis]
MKRFRHHSYFARQRQTQRWLLPHVCFICRKAYRKPPAVAARRCPQCGGAMTGLSRKFATPARSDIRQWKKVQYLVEHGFFFQSVYRLSEGGGYCKVAYPASLADAREFVRLYAAQAIARNDGAAAPDES